MNRDDILQAIRLTAMGRAGHPLQEQLADALAAVFAATLPIPLETLETLVEKITPQNVHEVAFPTAADPIEESEVQPVKRGPGRPKKAD